jgi:hypothetical protein
VSGELTVEAARAELSRLTPRVAFLRRFLREHTPAGLTQNERLAAVEFVKAGSTQVAAARLGMRHGDYVPRLKAACRKLSVDELGLPEALGLTDGVL